MGQGRRSAETAGNIVFRAFVLGMGKDFLGVAKLHHFPHQEEGDIVGNTGCLLHVVGDDDHGVFLLEFFHQVLDFHGGNGVQGGSGFVHQKDFRFHRQGPGDAQTLLLSAGKA